MNLKSRKVLVWVGPGLKWTIPPVIIWYMVSTGKLDLVKAIRVCGESWHFSVVAVSFFLVNTSLLTLRWKVCLEAQGIHESLFRVFNYTIIGMFFNIFMPGSLGGDVVKCYLVAQNNPETRARAVATVFIDRVHGLFVILLIGFISLIFNPVTRTSDELIYLTVMTGALLAGVTLFFVFALAFDETHPRITGILGKLPFGHILLELYGALATFRKQPSWLILTIPISILIISTSVFCFFILGRAIGENSPILGYFATVPVGFMAVTLPISPAGLGVGQGVYYTLFKWQGMNPANGAEAFSLFQLINLVCGLPGFFFYLAMRSRVDSACRSAGLDLTAGENPCEQLQNFSGEEGETPETACGSA